MSEAEAIRLREYFHAEGNRFGMMARHHRDEAAFLLGPEAARHLALVDKWRLGQHLSYAAASVVTTAAGIPEYGPAWDDSLQPDDLKNDCRR